ncbi:MAG: hypothetical protein EZS28_025317, partial [Streblomastix strix]
RKNNQREEKKEEKAVERQYKGRRKRLNDINLRKNNQQSEIKDGDTGTISENSFELGVDGFLKDNNNKLNEDDEQEEEIESSIILSSSDSEDDIDNIFKPLRATPGKSTLNAKDLNNVVWLRNSKQQQMERLFTSPMRSAPLPERIKGQGEDIETGPS